MSMTGTDCGDTAFRGIIVFFIQSNFNDSNNAGSFTGPRLIRTRFLSPLVLRKHANQNIF